MSTPLRERVPAERLASICREFGVRELAVFGSAARGEASDASDVDVLVSFEPGRAVGFLTLARLMRRLSELFDRPVDVVVREGLNPRIRDTVLREAEVLFAA